MPVIFSAFFLFKQAYIRHEMEEKLEKESLTTVFVRELVWVKKHKEIRIGENMFDVKTIEKIPEGFLVTGLYDHDEKAIHHELEKAVKSDTTDGEDGGSLLDLVFKKQFSTEQEAIDLFYPPLATRLNPVYALSTYTLPYIGISTPPPRASAHILT